MPRILPDRGSEYRVLQNNCVSPSKRFNNRWLPRRCRSTLNGDVRSTSRFAFIGATYVDGHGRFQTGAHDAISILHFSGDQHIFGDTVDFEGNEFDASLKHILFGWQNILVDIKRDKWSLKSKRPTGSVDAGMISSMSAAVAADGTEK